MRLVAAVLVLLVLGGCRSPEILSQDPLAGVPEDFSLDVRIVCGKDVPTRAEVDRRPGWFVVFPDGSLHSAGPGDRTGAWLPGRTRTLTRAEMAELWSLAQQMGFADPANGEPLVNFDLVEPTSDGIVYMLGFAGGGERWAFVQRAPDEEPGAARRMVRHLAELAWAADAYEDVIIVAPRRFDFGPDPYARYRR